MDANNLHKIKNPLVLIAVFAGVSEVAMAITLIKLPDPIQVIFVWFVMAFPMLLILGFFFVLYKKPAVLFSPSDYKKDEMYLESIGNSTGTAAISRRLDQLEESLAVVQKFVEDTDKESAATSNFSATWRQLEALHEMESNGLFEFMKSELELTSTEIANAVRDSQTADDLVTRVRELTNSAWKSERMRNVLTMFPNIYTDYDALKKVVRTGD